MALILDGNPEHVAHVWKRKNQIATAVDQQMPLTDQIADFTSSFVYRLPSNISTMNLNKSLETCHLIILCINWIVQ